NSRNDSLKEAARKGPMPANTPQAANPERMSAVVAVSRGPHRSAADNSGTTARNPSALLNPVCSISGLKAIMPTTPAAASTVAAAPEADQVPANDWRQGAARCDDQGHRNGVGGARIGEVGGYARHICRCKNRRPHANSAQEDGGEGETSRHPDRDHARVDRRD